MADFNGAACAGGDVATDSIWAAAGDIVYATADDTASVLSVGTNSDILQLSSGIPDWTCAPTLAALTVGSAGSGGDVTFHSATSGDQLLWDASCKKLVITGTACATALDVPCGNVVIGDTLYLYDAGGEYISSNGTALTIASGGVAWQLPVADGSACQVLKTDSCGNLDWATAGGGCVVCDTSPVLGGSLDASCETILNIGATGNDIDAGGYNAVNGTSTAPAYSFTCTTTIGMYRYDACTLGLASLSVNKGFLLAGGKSFMNDDTHTQIDSYGLTIQELTADKLLLALKSTDLNSGSTTLYCPSAETDDFGTFAKAGNTTGGLKISGIAGGHPAFRICGWAGGCDQTKSTSGLGVGIFTFHRHDTGNSKGAFTSDSNLLVIQQDDSNADNLTRFIFDMEGAMHGDVAATTFDDFCDIELMRGMLAETVPCYRERFGKDLMYNLDNYTDMKLIGKDSVHWEQRGCGKWQQRAMVNFTGLTMLHHSTIIQMHDSLQTIIQSQEQRITSLETQLALGGK